METFHWMKWASTFIRVLPKLYKVNDDDNKGMHVEEQNKFSQKIVSSGNKT